MIRSIVVRLGLLTVGCAVFVTLLGACDADQREAVRARREAEDRVGQVVEERLAERQTAIDAAMTEAQQNLDEAVAIAGGMPGGQEQLDLVQQDLDEVGRLLNRTVEQRAEVARAGLAEVIAAYGLLLEHLNDAAAQSEGRERMRIESFRDYMAEELEELVQAVEAAESPAPPQ